MDCALCRLARIHGRCHRPWIRRETSIPLRRYPAPRGSTFGYANSATYAATGPPLMPQSLAKIALFPPGDGLA
jgi:hypothetical protein